MHLDLATALVDKADQEVELEEAVVHLDKVDKQLNLAHLVNQVLMVMVTMVVLILTKHLTLDLVEVVLAVAEHKEVTHVKHLEEVDVLVHILAVQ